MHFCPEFQIGLRWLLNLSRLNLMAMLLFLNKPGLMAIYFLYGQDIIIQKKGIADVYWFTIIIFINYHLLNNMEEKHRSYVYWFTTIIFIHYHLFNNMEEKHRSYVYWFITIIFIHHHHLDNMEEKHRSCILV